MPATSAEHPIDRVTQVVLIASVLGASWLAMQAVHELGHVAAAWASGGRVERVVLHPLRISRTDVAPDPAPLLVAWAGPLLGSGAPCMVWAIARWGGWRSSYLFRFFAGFCLIANGGYLGTGSVFPVGDAAQILRNGGTRWSLALFGVILVPLGLWTWHRLGPAFGLGETPRHVNRRHAWGMLGLLAALAAAEAYWSG